MPSLIRTLSPQEPPDQVVDLRRIASAEFGENDQPVLALVRSQEQHGGRDYGKLVKGVDVAYNFAVDNLLKQVPAGVNATVRGGLVLWDGVELAKDIESDKADAIDVTLSLIKMGSDIAAILNSVTATPFNPLWTKAISIGCTVLLLIKEWHDSGEEKEKVAVCSFEPDDFRLLPTSDLQSSAYTSMALAGAALIQGNATSLADLHTIHTRQIASGTSPQLPIPQPEIDRWLRLAVAGAKEAERVGIFRSESPDGGLNAINRPLGRRSE